MNAVYVLRLFSVSFLIPDHQNMVLSASICVEPRYPTCRAYTTCFFSSSETTTLSPANNKPKPSIKPLNIGKIVSAARSFRNFCKHIFNFSTFGSTNVLGNRVHISTMKLNSTFLSFSFA